MKRKCYVCKKIFGFKEPYEDPTETHGVCGVCYPEEVKRIESEITRLSQKDALPTHEGRI